MRIPFDRFPAVEASVLQEAEWLIPPHILHDVSINNNIFFFFLYLYVWVTQKQFHKYI